MALVYAALSFSPCCYRDCFPEGRSSGFPALPARLDRVQSNAGGFLGFSLCRLAFRGRREASGPGSSKVSEPQTVDHAPNTRTSVEIPVTCYQILGVPDRAEKDEIVKSVMELKNAEIEEGYSMDAVISRQDLLMDVRDKLLFEPEYAGNAREKIPPKSSLRIPWAWLPGALCLLQEVGEEKMVLEIGRVALQHSDAKPYIHDLLLSMALAECSIAKAGFEKNKVVVGFEALARAQYLLKSKASLGNISLLSQIEESLEELAPACTLDLLSTVQTPENSERRHGAIAALRELLRQGLEVETSCRVQDWPCFLSQALNKLRATEIVNLLSWDDLAVTRKTKKTLDSQNQKIVIDFNCFYMAMLAHVALGFSSRQMDLINKARHICECLGASEGIALKFEEAFCAFLLGQGGEPVAAERLGQLNVNGSAPAQSFHPSLTDKEVKDKSLEMWLKDEVLGVFPDTRDCSPSLTNFFRGEKRILSVNKQMKGPVQNSPSVGYRTSEEPSLHGSSTRHLGAAVKQLAPVNLESQLAIGKSRSNTPGPSVQLKRRLDSNNEKMFESWWAEGDSAAKTILLTVIGCVLYATFKLLNTQLGNARNMYSSHSNMSRMSSSSPASPLDNSTGYNRNLAFIGGKTIAHRLEKLLPMLKKRAASPSNELTMQNSWTAVDDLSSFSVLHKKKMAHEEAETLVRQWQEVKAEALGPDHQIDSLPEVLADSMLAQWQALAESAKARACFWKFVLLNLSILRAEVIYDGKGGEMAEIEALLEEAAELVHDSQLKNPNYYSTYKIRYFLKRQDDGSWRFCAGGIQSPS